jgi:hypothetical protein
MAYIQTVLCMNKVSVLEICPRSSYNYILQRHAMVQVYTLQYVGEIK